jgi:hypothetical protein
VFQSISFCAYTWLFLSCGLVCLQILYGNLAPEGCVGKITGKEGMVFEGPARVYDSEEDMLAALSENPQSFKVLHRPHFCLSLQVLSYKILQRPPLLNPAHPVWCWRRCDIASVTTCCLSRSIS